MNLSNSEFDYIIDELVNSGVIKENEKEVELSEYVGNIVSDVKAQEVEDRISIDENGKEYLNVKAVYSKILKAKEQFKNSENKKESTLEWSVWSSNCTGFFYLNIW